MASQLVEPITALRNPPTAVAAMPTVPEVPAARPVGYMPVVRTAAPVPAPQGAEICSLRLQREANAVALSPDGRRAVVGFQDHTLQIWDLDARLLLHVLRGHKYWVNDVDYSRDGTWIASASADKSIKVWQASTGACKATLQGHLLSVSAVAFAGDRRRLASGSWDKTVCIWDTEETSPVQTLTGHTDWVHSVAWSPGGHHVASASSDHSVRVWDVFAGTVDCVLVGHLQTVSSVSFAANGVYLASGSLDGTVRVWNLKEGALAARLTQDTDGSSVHSVTFSAEGEMIVVACADRSIKVWSLSTSEQLTSLNGHEDPVQCVATTSDGRAVSCSHDKTMRVWRLPRPVAILTKAPPALVPRVAMLSPGRGAVTRLSPRMQDLQAQLKESERRNQQLKAHLSEAQSEASRGDLSRSEVSRLQSGGDNVAEGATEDPAARVPETPPKLKLPTSPAGSAKRMSAAPPTAAATAAAPQCWSMLPTTMAGSGAPTTDARVKPIPVISCPAGSAMSGACGGALQPGTVKMISEPVVQPPSLLSSGYLYGRPRPVAH